MVVSDLDPKASDKEISTVPSLDSKERDNVCSAKQEKPASAETQAAIAQHPLANLFGKYGGGYWDELFAALEQDLLDRQNR